MVKCSVCNNDYSEGDLERHLIMYHTTTNENIAKYLAYLQRRIETLEAALPRPKPEP
jgi:hypothetical protein